MRGLHFYWACAIGIGVGGCSLFTDLDGLTGGDAGAADTLQDANASTDGAAFDGAARDGAPSDAGDDNLIVNPGFEEGTGGCGPGWSATNGTLTRSTTAHSGSYSCEACVATGTWTNVHATPYPVTNPTAGQAYYAEVWVRPVADAPLTEISLDLEEADDGGSTTLAFVDGDPTGSTWQRVQANNFIIGHDGADIDFSVHLISATDGSGCVLIDSALMNAQ